MGGLSKDPPSLSNLIPDYVPICFNNPIKSLDRAYHRRTSIPLNLHHRRHNSENSNTYRPKPHGNNIQQPRTIFKSIHIVHTIIKNTKQIQLTTKTHFRSRINTLIKWEVLNKYLSKQRSYIGMNHPLVQLLHGVRMEAVEPLGTGILCFLMLIVRKI